MSDRIYNIDRVVDKIGVKEKIQYDKIDVFIDAENKNNVWAIVYYTEDQRKKRVLREQILRFKDYNEMLLFVKNHFDTYELDHRVDYLQRKIFMHDVDYNNINYYLHDGRPDLNYVEVNYKEYVNDGFHLRQKRLPKEYNDMLVDILKINKKIDQKEKLGWDLYHTVDVYAAKKEKDDKEKTPRISRYERRIEKEKHQIPTGSAKKSHRIRNLAIASIVVVSTVMTAGYVLEKKVEYKKEVVVQNNAIIYGKDATISQNKEKAGIIISALFDGNYAEVSQDDFNMAVDFINLVGQSNFDNNKSSTYFEYNEFFSIKFYENSEYSAQDAYKINGMLDKTEKLYESCFKQVGNEVFLNAENTKKYLDYALSLTFMYDTTVDSLGSNQVIIPAQDTNLRYATQEEIMAFNQCPAILRYIILNQLKTVLSHANYQVEIKPSNYFGGLDKYDLLNHVSQKLDNIASFIKVQCNDNNKKGI